MKRFLKKISRNKKLKTIVLFLLLVAVVFVPVGKAHAAWYIDLANTFVYMLFNLTSFLLGIATDFMSAVLHPDFFYHTFFSPAAKGAINITWAAIRDFFNMGFILILILISISIILRVPKFNDKKLIFRVILAALLINFSKSIAMAIIDFSQLAMNFFLNLVQSKSTTFAFSYLDNASFSMIWKMSAEDGFQFFAKCATAVVFSFLMAAMIFVIAISLIIRMVTFYMLIVLSPMAMFGLALPGTIFGTMSSSWFEKMYNWAFFGPVMIFFLWVAMTLLNAITLSGDKVSDIGGASFFSMQGSVNLAGNFIKYFVAIYLLYYGFDLSRSMASKVSGVLNKWMDYGMKKINAAPKLALKTVGAATGVSSAGVIGKERLSKTPYLRRLTKQGRKEAREEQDDKMRTRIGSKSQRNEAIRKQAYKIEKDWKESGAPSESDLKKLLDNGTNVEKIAAARKLAEMGKLGVKKDKDGQVIENYYEKALEAVGHDQSLSEEVSKSAKKNNMESIIAYRAKIAEEFASKGEVKGKNREETQRKEAELNKIIEDAAKIENVKRLDTSMGPQPPQLANLEQKKEWFKNQDFKNEGGLKQKVHNLSFRGMKMGDIKQQEASFHASEEFKQYMTAGEGVERFEWKNRRDAFADLDEEQQFYWRTNGIYVPTTMNRQRATMSSVGSVSSGGNNLSSAERDEEEAHNAWREGSSGVSGSGTGTT